MLAVRGKVAGVNLHHGANNDELPLRMSFGQLAQQLNVQALIYYAKKPDARMRNFGLVGGVSASGSRAWPKWALSMLLGKAWASACCLLLASYRLWPPVNTRSARWNSSCSSSRSCGVGKFEICQLVHAVVHGERRLQMARLA